jgi:CheY-like chemotaxis protein
MSEFVSKLFSSDFMPHGACYLWRPEIVWLHATSDTLIALSYYLIPIVLIYFVRKRIDLPFNWILDVQMPGMNGLELQLRLAAASHPIPIIFITAFGDESVRARALRGGAVSFLTKPFSEDALLGAVQSAIEVETQD